MIVVKSSKQNIQVNKLTAFKLNRYKIKAGCQSELVKRLLEADDIIERSCLGVSCFATINSKGN